METQQGFPGNQQSKPAFCQIRIHRSLLKQESIARCIEVCCEVKNLSRLCDIR